MVRCVRQEVPPQQHPVIVLPTVERDVMRAVLEFIYCGQVNVRQARLGAFLQVAETFAIQGLADEQTKRSSAKVRGRSVSGWAVPAAGGARSLSQQLPCSFHFHSFFRLLFRDMSSFTVP